MLSFPQSGHFVGRGYTRTDTSAKPVQAVCESMHSETERSNGMFAEIKINVTARLQVTLPSVVNVVGEYRKASTVARNQLKSLFPPASVAGPVTYNYKKICGQPGHL